MIQETGVSQLQETVKPQSPAFMTAVWAIVWKDIRLERHTKQTLSVMLLYSLAIVIMFNFALETNLAAVREVATGLLWATIILAVTLGLNRSLAIERENNSLDAILMAPINRGAVYAGKVISITLLALAMEALLVVVFTVFFNKPFWRPQVLFILLLGTIGYTAAGVLVTSMTIQARANEVLLPVLLLPLSMPLVLPAAMAVSSYMLPELPPIAEVQSPLALIAMYDLLMLVVGFSTYHYVVEA